jgi:hypothetical protein
VERDGLLLRTFKSGEAKLNAYLEDYACLIDGLISVYEATGELGWLENAVRLTETMIEQFWDDEEGGFFFTGKSHEQLIVRSKDFMDNATPSGNSVAAVAMQKLSLLTGNEEYQRHATAILRLLADQIRRYPSAFSWALCGLDFYLSTPKEIALVGKGDSPQLADLQRVVWHTYLPNRVIASSINNHEKSAKIIPLLQGRGPSNGAAKAFVCQAYTCQTPAETPSQLREQLAARQA